VVPVAGAPGGEARGAAPRSSLFDSSDMIERSDKVSPWTPRQLMLAAVMVAVAVLAMGSSWADWLEISASDPEFSQVFLVIPFGAIILYVDRARLKGVKVRASWVGPLIVGSGWLLAWYGYNNAHQSMWHAGAVLVALGAGIAVLGHGVLIRFFAVFLMLAFMVPLSNRTRLQIAEPLQHAMAIIVANVLGFFGEPVGRQGNLLTVNGQQVAIAEACNGLRMVFTLILVCWLFAFATPLKTWVRWLVILLSPVTALVCNVFRLIPTLLLYGHAKKETADGFHDIAGWLMLPAAFLILMLVIHTIEAFGIEVRSEEEGIVEKDEERHARMGVAAGSVS
jgi:exosortase